MNQEDRKTQPPSNEEVKTIEEAKIKVTESWKLDTWSPFSQQHAYSACYLAKRAAEFDKKYTSPSQLSECGRYEYQALVIGSVFAAHAFLESTINDIFIEADREDRGDRPTHDILKLLTRDVIASMAQIWRFGVQLENNDRIELSDLGEKTKAFHKGLGICLQESKTDVERWSFLNKYQLAYYLANEKKSPKVACFKDQSSSWEHIRLLVDLRNYFTHHKSEPITYEGPHKGQITPTNKKELLRTQTRRLRGELQKGRKCENRLFEGAFGLHPLEDLLGSKCANWAVEMSLTFADEFSKETDIELYGPVRKLVLKRSVAGCGL